MGLVQKLWFNAGIELLFIVGSDELPIEHPIHG